MTGRNLPAPAVPHVHTERGIGGGVTSPPKSGHSLKTGFLVSAFKDSDDMKGLKFKGEDLNDPAYLMRVVGGLVGLGFETVMVERVKP